MTIANIVLDHKLKAMAAVRSEAATPDAIGHALAQRGALSAEEVQHLDRSLSQALREGTPLRSEQIAWLQAKALVQERAGTLPRAEAVAPGAVQAGR